MLDPFEPVEHNYRPTAKLRQLALKRSGFRCAFPGCNVPPRTDEGVSVLEMAHIVGRIEGGRSVLDNIIILCPAHHRLVDRSPIQFGVDTLIGMRAAHEATLALTFECSEEVIAAPAMPAKAKHTLESALRFWEEQKMCDDEDVWHEFFSANGEILALSLPGSALQIGSKCFVGGKDYLNQGGGITDFIYTPHDYEGVTLVEIKTPETRLIGSQYRNRCFAPSADLSGSVVQALHYKRLAQSDLQKLFERAARKPSFDDIQVAVLVGKSESLDTESEKRRSFQLFKSAVREVQIITYDELFGKVKMILEIPR